MSCGCGCNDHGGKGSCKDISMSMIPKIGGVNPIAYVSYMGVPSPTGYQGLSGFEGLGLGLGDCGDCIAYDLNGNCIETDPTGCASTSIPTPVIPISTIPVIPPAIISPATATTSPSSNVNWNNIATAWTNITGQILKSEAGANPTYQSINPLTGASTTIYGSLPANLQASLAQPIAGSLSLGSLLLFGGIGLVALLVLKK